ncbi:MAG: TrkA C-terminal domain-containing protein [Candidatus Omnitrophota bacterium]
MSILLFFVAIIVSVTVVRIGAIAFQLTGVEWSVAKFQSLSCFSGTGYTTKEAELISGHPQRRRIASILMVLGNAGVVTLIATFANTLQTESFVPNFIPALRNIIPQGLMPWVDILIIIAFLYLIYKLFTRSTLSLRFTDFARARMIKKEMVSRVTFEELSLSTGGYGVSSIEVRTNSPMLNKTLVESGLRQRDITILAIERKGEMIPNPPFTNEDNFGGQGYLFRKAREHS